MWSNKQKRLVHQAARYVRLQRDDYEACLRAVTGWPDCVSSTDPRLTEEHLDRLMRWWEFDYWAAVDNGEIEHRGTRSNPFRIRSYWRNKNTREETSRDRYTAAQLRNQIAQAETELMRLGNSRRYLESIKQRTGDGWPYYGALKRTVAYERKARRIQSQ